MLTVALNLGGAGAEARTGCRGREEPVQGQGETPTALGMRGLKEQQEETEKKGGEREKRRQNVLFLECAAIPARP